jgi:hypothetical protein
MKSFKQLRESTYLAEEGTYNPSNKAHTTVKKLMGKYDSADLMSKGVRAHYHPDGTASISTKNREAIKTVSQTHLKGDHSHQNKMLSHSTHKVGDLHYTYKNTDTGHKLHIHENAEYLDESYRNLAVHGIGFSRHEVPAKGQHLDFYHSQTGDKREGKIIRKSKSTDHYTVEDVHTKERHHYVYYEPTRGHHQHVWKGGTYHVPVKEEVEQLVEISKNTLGSYIKKAKDDSRNSAWHAGVNSTLSGVRNKIATKLHTNREIKRAAGIDRATEKLVKK